MTAIQIITEENATLKIFKPLKVDTIYRRINGDPIEDSDFSIIEEGDEHFYVDEAIIEEKEFWTARTSATFNNGYLLNENGGAMFQIK